MYDSFLGAENIKIKIQLCKSWGERSGDQYLNLIHKYKSPDFLLKLKQCNVKKNQDLTPVARG